MESLEVERWRNLCELAAREQEPQKLQALVLELTKFLEKEIRARQQRNARRFKVRFVFSSSCLRIPAVSPSP